MPFFSDKFRHLVITYRRASVDVGTEGDCKANPRLLSSTPQCCDDGFFASPSSPVHHLPSLGQAFRMRLRRARISLGVGLTKSHP
jgi:hypothetical protein